MKLTHDNVWKNKPSEKTVFVTDFFHKAVPVLDKNKKIRVVLDVACGNGVGATLPILRRGLEVYAFDHLDSAIKAVKKNSKNEGFKVHTKKASMYKRFPYKNNFFDAVFCFQAIYHGKLEQITFTLSEIKRVLKENGHFFATILNYELVRYDKKRKLHYFNVKLPKKNMFRSYLKQYKKEPHLFYFLSKDFEYMQAHYYFSKDELEKTLKKYFRKVEIKKVTGKPTKLDKFWYVHCQK